MQNQERCENFCTKSSLQRVKIVCHWSTKSQTHSKQGFCTRMAHEPVPFANQCFDYGRRDCKGQCVHRKPVHRSLSLSKSERICVLLLLAVLVWSCKTRDSLRWWRVFSSYWPCWTLLLSTQAREFIQLCFLLMQWVKGVSRSTFFLDLHVQSKVMCILACLLLKCAHFKVSWNMLEMLLKGKHSDSFYIGYKYSLLQFFILG